MQRWAGNASTSPAAAGSHRIPAGDASSLLPSCPGQSAGESGVYTHFFTEAILIYSQMLTLTSFIPFFPPCRFQSLVKSEWEELGFVITVQTPSNRGEWALT